MLLAQTVSKKKNKTKYYLTKTGNQYGFPFLIVSKKLELLSSRIKGLELGLPVGEKPR